MEAVMKKIVVSLTMAVLVVAVYITGAVATTIRVPADAGTIQAGITQASSGDTVLVACGIYYEHDINMKPGVRLLSETGLPDCVTIDAQQQGGVMRCRFTGSTTRIEGFTITGGYVPESPDDGNGGGMYIFDNASPWVVNCVITGNFADFDGGGVCCYANASPNFVDCTISGNEAGNGGSGMRFNDNSSPTLTNCTVSDNIGTGIWTGNFSSPELVNCIVSGNTGRGIYHETPTFGRPGHITLTDCKIKLNSGTSGAGMFVWNGDATLTNCVFYHNEGSSEGGALCCLGGSVTLTDCFMRRNTAYRGGGIYLRDGAEVTAQNVEFLYNTADDVGPDGFVDAGSQALLTCCVEDLTGFAGGGTITLDNEGCFSPTSKSTWGRLKSLYQ
jgi:parallel beta-helix repeat protein